MVRILIENTWNRKEIFNQWIDHYEKNGHTGFLVLLANIRLC